MPESESSSSTLSLSICLSVRLPVNLMDPYAVYTASERPDLWEALEDPQHPLNVVWPEFLDHDPAYARYCGLLSRLSALAPFQFAFVRIGPQGQEVIAGLGRSIPFFWPELSTMGTTGWRPELLDSLPDKGYSAILATGVQQSQEGGPPPNALSALSVTVQPAYRQTGLAELIIDTMKRAALSAGFSVLVAPLRPTQKLRFPDVPMERYLSWTTDSGLPFDPWLRKHIRLGGQVAKIATNSMVVSGTREQWKSWVGIDLHQVAQQARDQCYLADRVGMEPMYMSIPIPGGLVPVAYDVKDQVGLYVEPNVWVSYRL
ncbi:hypothetical protein P170DRAFT_439629 [Aspergillus steynii IBT 23096]|uniref:Uncharacterized protein n=1 Tax=Aspergillus steynii IBT 23096 TaxID=1392250 RepID=A0A2I2FZ74_9EURO|nr:uncharacterized protein P170DRAFT_439629 [Aspergillus steynii IBT 23096]PLB45932.1 hypothetical protein P170DRAFT_439629 [Aspergillus steynii IBT 23096]